LPSSARPPITAIKRPLLALAIVLGILGTVWAYERFQASVKQPVSAPAEHLAAAAYALDITLTFPAAADAFALNEPYSLLLTFRGETLLKETEPIDPGRPLQVKKIPNVVEGRNEFYLEVTPAENDEPRDHAVRLRILRDDVVVAEQTLWSPPGEPVQGLMTLTVPAAAKVDEHE
jgi:hypothetical protein